LGFENLDEMAREMVARMDAPRSKDVAGWHQDGRAGARVGGYQRFHVFDQARRQRRRSESPQRFGHRGGARSLSPRPVIRRPRFMSPERRDERPVHQDRPRGCPEPQGQLRAAGVAEAAANIQREAESAIVRERAEARKPGGRPLDSQAIDKQKQRKEAAKLLGVLPADALGEMLGTSLDDLLDMDRDLVADLMVGAWANRYAHDPIAKARRALASLLEFAAEGDFPEKDAEDPVSSGIIIAAFLRERDRLAKEAAQVAEGADEENLRAAVQNRAAPRYGAGGKTAAPAVKSALGWLKKNAGLSRMPLDLPIVKGALEAAERHFPKPAPPLGLGVLYQLERLATDDGAPQHVRVVAAGWLSIIIGAQRIAQASRTDLLGRVGDVGVGVCARAKARVSRACLVLLPLDLFNGSRWFDVLYEGLPKGANFLLCDVQGGDGDPFHPNAKGLARGFPTEKRAVRSLRGMLEHFGMDKDDAAMFSGHSARHTVPQIAAIRKVKVEDRAEIGAWYGSSLQDKDMIPEVRDQRQRAARVGAMPERYAQGQKAQRIVGIIQSQLEAVKRAAVRLGGPQHLPLKDEWDVLSD